MKKKVVGLGEVLWDILPGHTCLGGAPANFAYITTLMGDQGIVASRVGEDSRGVEALRRMEEVGLNIDLVQTDPSHPTGTVNVEIDGNGQARFDIAHPVAWDFLEWTPDLADAGARCGCNLLWIVGAAIERQSRDHSEFPASDFARDAASVRCQPQAALLLPGSLGGVDAAG